MNTFAKAVITTAMLSLSACSQGQDDMNREEFFVSKAIANLEAASVWIIEAGIEVFSQEGRNGVFRKLLDEWSVQLWVDPWIETDTYLARFGIKSRGINYEIINLYREPLFSDIYEFWIVKVDGANWSGESRRAMFYVTKASDVSSRREILISSDQFIDSYSVNEDTVLHFPKGNAKILFDMEAWLYPNHYKDSDLKDIRVIRSRSGQFETQR